MICEIERQLIWASGAAGTTLTSSEPEIRTLEALNKGWEGIAELSTILNYHSLLLDEAMFKLVHEWMKQMQKSISEIGNEVEQARLRQESKDTGLKEREAFILAVRDHVMERDIPILGETKRNLEVLFREAIGNKNKLEF